MVGREIHPESSPKATLFRGGHFFSSTNNEQRAKFVNEVQHLTHFIEKVDSELPSGIMMLIRQPLTMKNGCELTKNRRYTIFEPLLQFNEAK